MSLVLLLAACDPDGEVEEPLYSGDWERPNRSQLDTLDLPQNEDGEYLLVAGAGVTLTVDPDDRTPASAAGECASLLIACLAPERNMLGCFQNVPVCDSDEPWTGDEAFCCHPSCEERYVELRKDGLREPDAFTHAVFGPPACSPGLDDSLAAERNR